MASIMIVPGLAVRGYAVPAAQLLEDDGHRVGLLPAPTWRGVPDQLVPYGRWLADRVRASRSPVDLLVGLSIGTQAAAVAALHCDVPRLLLVSPTVDPALRCRRRLFATWLRGDRHPDSQGLGQQVPDWSRAGPRRIYRGMMSAIDLPLEDVLPKLSGDLTIVHAGWDNLTSFEYAASLAADTGARLLELPAAPHSWPIGDTARFAAVVRELLSR